MIQTFNYQSYQVVSAQIPLLQEEELNLETYLYRLDSHWISIYVWIAIKVYSIYPEYSSVDAVFSPVVVIVGVSDGSGGILFVASICHVICC